MATNSHDDSLPPLWVWGLPLAPLTFQQTLDRIEDLIRAGKPNYFITANLHYAMLTDQDPRLDAVNRKAALVLADGMPLVWASRWRPARLPERVTGSDLVPALCELAARRGYRVYLLGGSEEVSAEAARKLCERFPGLQIAGVYSPPFRPLSAEEQAALIARIGDARPDLLFVAFGQPKGEFWLAQHCEALGVPACAQIGATLDFLAGRVPRAPRWLQRVGLEWVYRLYQEPGRLARRYGSNLLFAFKMLACDLFARGAYRDGVKTLQDRESKAHKPEA
ncbi:MAG TPA: WecB/TagA/CpsF family glycosyltransferase [Gemmataceae bacterium]|nr:WecB/TagA/CpsF family glycosyltransferase [Gemmataceae bacterium]